MLPLLALSMGASLLGQGAGTIMSLRANKKQQRELARRQHVLGSWFNKEYNQDYLSGTEAKSALRNVMDNIRDQNKALAGRAAMTGASDEAQVASREQQGKTYAGFVNQLAARGAARRDSIRSEYMNRQDTLNQQQDQLSAQRQQTYANIASNAGNILSSASSAASIGAFDTSEATTPTPTGDTSSLLNTSGTLKTNWTNPLRTIPLLT
jgi:hypothetical protein